MTYDDDEDMTWDDADGRYPVVETGDSRHCPICGGFMVYQGIDDGCGYYGDSLADIFACANCEYTEERNLIRECEDEDRIDADLVNGAAPDGWGIDEL